MNREARELPQAKSAPQVNNSERRTAIRGNSTLAQMIVKFWKLYFRSGDTKHAIIGGTYHFKQQVLDFGG